MTISLRQNMTLDLDIEGLDVNVTYRDGKTHIQMTQVPQGKRNESALKQLVSLITDENRHPEI